MWLILVGLTFLAGDVLSQANNVINSKTDLLPMGSDQLIHSSAELIAMEDQNTGLPFGARLPGYEKPLYSYSYTIRKDSNHDDDSTTEIKTTRPNSHSTSKNVIYLHNFNILNNTKNETEPLTKTSTSDEENNGVTNLTEHISHNEIKEENQNHTLGSNFGRSGIFNQEIAVKGSEDSSRELRSNDVSPEGQALQVPNLKLDYLPPVSNKLPAPKLNLDYLPPETEPTPLSNLGNGHLPPSEKSEAILPGNVSVSFKVPNSNLNKIQAKETGSKSSRPLDYLPPKAKKDSSIKLNLGYLPPKGELTINDNIGIDSLTPQKSIKLDYLPPSREAPEIKFDYLPPSREAPEVTTDYLPPIRSNTFSAVVPITSLRDNEPQSIIPIGIINRNLVPLTSSFASVRNKINPPITVMAEEKGHSRTSFLNSYLPPSKGFNQKNIPDIKPEIGILRTNLKEEKIEPISDTKRQTPSPVSTESSLTKNEPGKVSFFEEIIAPTAIGIRRKENRLKPDAVVQEIKNQPIYAKAERSTVVPDSIVHEHKKEPIKTIADYPDSLPYGGVHSLSNPTIEPPTRKVSLKPDYQSKRTINEPILPKSKNPIVPFAVIEDKEEKPIVGSKVQSQIPQTNFNEIINEPIIPIKEESKESRHGFPSRIRAPRPHEQNVLFQLPPRAEFTNKVIDDPIVPQALYTASPITVTYENNTKISVAKTNQKSYNSIPQYEKAYQCLLNDECDEKEICQNGFCIPGCSIAAELCIGDASCETRHHVPACICPLMSTAKTIRNSGTIKFDCVPMKMPTSASNAVERSRNAIPTSLNPLSYQRPIVAPVRTATTSASFSRPITHSISSIRATSAGNPCSPSPCGPNTRCEVNNRGIALCRCIEDYVPDGNTINGCKPQCVSDNDCPDDYQCQRNKCARVCVPGACGLNADCNARNHRADCSCPRGYNGNPDVRCSREIPEVRAPPPLPVDPCIPNPCGTNADCNTRGERPVCSCPVGYEGNPLISCERGECIAHNDCPRHLACQNLRCIDPCVGVCGSGSECTVRDHQPVCSCPRNFMGDPFVSCRRVTEYDICNPSPCGRNTNCRARTDRDGSMRAVCSCIDNYIGSPLTECRPECVRDTDCSPNQHCENNRCRNPCVDGCGEGAYCDVRNHRAVCTCPEFYKGDAQSRCYPECTKHEDCSSFEACYQFQCIDPCEGACGTSADCKVENHTPICSCPRGYTGDPFRSCRAFTLEDLCNDNPCGTNAECHPGKDRSGNDRPVCTCPRGYIGNPLVSCQRGECEDHNSCPDHEACYAYMCQSPCYTEVGSVCGDNAECKVKNHKPVCSCPRGYTGNPLHSCQIAPNARIAGRSHRKQ